MLASGDDRPQSRFARNNPETKFYSPEKLSKSSEAIVMTAGFTGTDLAR
jgi:hypothetical protein